MVSQDKLIKQGIYLTDNVFEEIIKRLSKGVKSSDTLEAFINKTKDYTMNNPLVVNGFKEDMLDIILKETNNHKFSRPAQKELVRLTIENRVGDRIVDVGDDIKESVRDIVKEGYNNNLSQDEIAENISHRVSVIKNTRARTIARTEIARTATASDYVINKERGATHFTVDCRKTCCDVCRKDYNFGKVEYTIDQVEMLPPKHPNCRCYALFFKKEGKNTLNNALGAKGIPTPKSNNDSSSFFDNYKAPKGAKPIVLSKDVIEKELEGFIDSNEIPIVLALFNKFNEEVTDCNYEWIHGITNKGSSPKNARTDNKKTEVFLHESLRNLKAPETLLVVIHNHIWGMTPLYSDKDLRLYLSNNIKYGVTTNEMGLFVVKNNNKKKLTKKEIDVLIDEITEVDAELIKKFNKDNKLSYDSENDNHKYLLNEYLKKNFDYWQHKYNSILLEYNMEVTFINANKYNKT